MSLQVCRLQVDEWNEEEMARHGVTPIEVLQVLNGSPKFFPNKKRHSASILMIGPTFGGRLLTVPLAETSVHGLWRPATAFPSNSDETARYYSGGGR